MWHAVEFDFGLTLADSTAAVVVCSPFRSFDRSRIIHYEASTVAGRSRSIDPIRGVHVD